MPDFGIFRGFNDKLFGNKLYAGQLPTQLGTIGSLNINFIDIHNVFDREDNPLDLFPFKMFNHYNPEGYRKVAKEIFDLTIDK